MLPIYREREVGFITRQAKSKLLVVPSAWSGFDFEAMAKGIAATIAAEGGGPLEVLVADKALPQGDPSTLPPPPDPTPDRCAGTSTRRARRPIRRARAHRPHDQGQRLGCASASRSPMPT